VCSGRQSDNLANARADESRPQTAVFAHALACVREHHARKHPAEQASSSADNASAHTAPSEERTFLRFDLHQLGEVASGDTERETAATGSIRWAIDV
jgi:hypothetical protein